MPISSGTVAKRSTSSGDRPGASVAICTWTLVTSGKASSDSLRAASSPKANSTAASTATISRWARALRTSDSIMSPPSARAGARC